MGRRRSSRFKRLTKKMSKSVRTAAKVSENARQGFLKTALDADSSKNPVMGSKKTRRRRMK